MKLNGEMIDMRIAMIGWEYPPFKAGGLATHCYGLTRGLADKNVKAVLINIFGGIVRCDRVAKGVIEATSKVDINLPVVIRLQGTNAEEAAEILNNSDLEFSVATNLKDAAEKVVAAIQS